MVKRKSKELLRHNARIHKNTMEFIKQQREKKGGLKMTQGNMPETKFKMTYSKKKIGKSAEELVDEIKEEKK